MENSINSAFCLSTRVLMNWCAIVCMTLHTYHHFDVQYWIIYVWYKNENSIIRHIPQKKSLFIRDIRFQKSSLFVLKNSMYFTIAHMTARDKS